MAWTLAQLRAAYAALSPVPSSLTEAAATLNAQTQTITVNVPVQSIAGYLGSQNKLVGFLEWAASPPTGASAAAVNAAKAFVLALQNSRTFPVFQMTNPAIAANMENDLAALVSPGTGVTGPITAAGQPATPAHGAITRSGPTASMVRLHSRLLGARICRLIAAFHRAGVRSRRLPTQPHKGLKQWVSLRSTTSPSKRRVRLISTPQSAPPG